MTMLRESPWYLEIEAEALQRGLQQGMQQGMQQGKREGKQEGKQEGQAELVLRLLARRFEAVPPLLAERVRAVPSTQMPDLLDVVLEAGSLADVSAVLDGMLAGGGNGRSA